MSYEFEKRAVTILKQSIKDELNRATKLGFLLSKRNLKDKLNKDYEFDTKFFDDNNKTSRILGTDKIISIAFLPTPFINQFGERTETPRLDIEICAVGVGVSQNIVKTELINQKGTIKEIISQPDYSVTISGILIGFFGRPTVDNPMASKPAEDMRKLLEISESKISVKVLSDTLNLYGINRLCIESLNMPQELSDINLQRFNLNASSDSEDLVIL
jgi:hypothetical protein